MGKGSEPLTQRYGLSGQKKRIWREGKRISRTGYVDLKESMGVGSYIGGKRSLGFWVFFVCLSQEGGILGNDLSKRE